MSGSRIRRRADRVYLGDLDRRLAEWDPLGLIALGAPRDEYDCLLATLVSGLRDDMTAEQLAQALRDRIIAHFGDEPFGTERFAAEVIGWHRTTRVGGQ